MSADGFRKVGHGTFVEGRLITAQQSDIRVAMGRQEIQYAPVYVREADLTEPEPASRQALARQRLNNLIALAQAGRRIGRQACRKRMRGHS